MENNKVVVKLYDVKNTAEYLDLTPKRVKQLTDEGIITEYRKGYYWPEKVGRQYIKYKHRQEAGTSPAVGLNLNQERAKLVSIKSQNEQLELDHKLGIYHKADEVEYVVLNMLMSFRSKCMTLPQTIVGKIAGEENPSVQIDLIRAEILGVLEELQDYDNLFSEDEEES